MSQLQGLTGLLLAGMLVALMGYAIQRGATCMVAAVEEWFSRGSARRSLAIGEASLWVLGGLAMLQLSGWAQLMPVGFKISAWTALGGVLLGLGAAVNRACVFGTVARFGGGDWAYAFTPLGYLLGALAGAAMLPLWLPGALPAPEQEISWLHRPGLAAGLLVLSVSVGAWMLWRVRQVLRTPAIGRQDASRQPWPLWQPHEATLVIGVSFVLLLALAGRWTYIELLSDWAHGRFDDSARRLLLLVALGAGAVWGGLRSRRLTAQPWRLDRVLRFLLGGALMGLGAELVPGANDGLLLLGLPLLWPHAWLAVATMTLSLCAWFGLNKLGPLPRNAG